MARLKRQGCDSPPHSRSLRFARKIGFPRESKGARMRNSTGLSRTTEETSLRKWRCPIRQAGEKSLPATPLVGVVPATVRYRIRTLHFSICTVPLNPQRSHGVCDALCDCPQPPPTIRFFRKRLHAGQPERSDELPSPSPPEVFSTDGRGHPSSEMPHSSPREISSVPTGHLLHPQSGLAIRGQKSADHGWQSRTTDEEQLAGQRGVPCELTLIRCSPLHDFVTMIL